MGQPIRTGLMNKDIQKYKEFGILMGTLIPTLFILVIPFLFNHERKYISIVIGLFFILTAISKPKLLKKPYIWWMKFGGILGWINSYLILGMVYLIVLIPISLIMKIFGHDPLSLNIKKTRTSFKIYNRKRTFDLEKIF